ncbi:hypothetical protein Theco_2415 [Thermobacillus composti KWC4]|uniref:Putative zinc-finger domain-containing protein n=1 Tax=Thermobacillus composti (strain DSM 18247 / JCM 13945 / KWC4) TaxID=717605 RepID=L0EE05_THECK|nr:zf-HC2 domain-containing protein [Thermobacillus composti]AGA58523.1 hypothetical protein Theco_2415 [Thermobacillus composti KWC4]
MNCQEVMEYMQRELDGDLGEFESAKAREHIRQCAECAAMFERLKRLSAELESLPKVTPPISLVDAILPKLDEIDRVKAAASADAGAAELAGSAGSPARTAPRRRNNRFSLRILSGVVAAGVVAGIFFATYDPDRLSDSFSGDRAAKESASSGSSEPMLMMDAAADSPDAQDGSDVSMKKSFHLTEVRDQSGQAIESSPGSAGRSGDSATDADAGSGEGDVRMAPPVVLQGVNGGIESPEDDVQMGVAGFVEEPAFGPVESVSPDGSYIAVFSESRVIIYDRDGNTRFESEERQGSIAAMGWSEDGAFFRYEIRREDGAAEIYRINPADGTETKE